MVFPLKEPVVISGSKFYPAALGAIQAATCCHSHVDLEPSPRDLWPWMRRCPCGRVGRASRLWKFEWWQWTCRIDIIQNHDSVWSGEALLFSIHSSCTRKINLQGVKPFKTPQTSETSWYLESLRTCGFSKEPKFSRWQTANHPVKGMQRIPISFENYGMNLPLLSAVFVVVDGKSNFLHTLETDRWVLPMPCWLMWWRSNSLDWNSWNQEIWRQTWGSRMLHGGFPTSKT